MTVAKWSVTLACDCSKVWDLVTCPEKYAWRSDLRNVELRGERCFVEYTKQGFPTTFTVTAVDPGRRWELDMENENLTGHWTGLFAQAPAGAALTFTEQIRIKKLWMRPLARLYLQKQQAAYLADLKRALGCR